MQRIVSFFLLITFLFSAIGCYLLFFYCDMHNRRTIQNQMADSGSLLTLYVHKSEIKNIVFRKEGKEFMFNGEMYDIKNSYWNGNYMVFICKHDKRETELLAGLSVVAKQNADSGSHNEKQSNKLLKDIFFSVYEIFLLVFHYIVVIPEEFNFHSRFLFSMSPPPEVFPF